MTRSSGKLASIAFAAAMLWSGLVAAQDDCAICSSEIVTNGGLADCFLTEYGKLEEQAGPAVAVDLSQCPSSRGVIKGLPVPGQAAEVPDVVFTISKTKLECLKKKLEEPGVVLDPTAKINLDHC